MDRKKRAFRWLILLAVVISMLGAGSTAHAQALGLKAVSATPFVFNGVTIPGMPSWYQDQNGVSVEPCLDIAQCALAGALPGPGPVAFPNNFPEEGFYFNATADVAMGGGANALVVMAVEFVFADAFGTLVLPATPGATAAVFQRLRLIEFIPGGGGVLPPAAQGGNFTVDTPWGLATFAAGGARCANQGGNTKCTMTRDIGGVVGANAAALAPGAPGAISIFLKDPAAPAGLLGTGAAAASYTIGAGGPIGSVAVTDPLGNTGRSGILSLLLGKTIGMEVTPNIVKFAPQTTVVSKTSPTITVKNPNTVATMPLGAITVTGADVTNFTVPVATDTCSNATLPASGTCTFVVAFSEPNATALGGPRAAVINIGVPPAATVPPGVVNVSGTIDVIPPTIAPVTPVDGTHVPANSPISAHFSELVTGLSSTTFTLTGPAGPVAGTVTFDVNTMTGIFTPAVNLDENNVQYTATIVGGATGVTDLAGNPIVPSPAFAPNFEWSFLAVPPDLTPPTVVSITPGDGAQQVDPLKPVAITFSEPMDHPTLNETNITVKTLSSSVTGSVSYDDATKTATFTPATPLAYGIPYTVTVNTGVKDLAGNSLAAAVTSKFFTNFAPTPPVLALPENGATGISAASVEFSWHKSSDQDGDALTYHLFYCKNEFFVGCETPVTVTPVAASLNSFYAGLGGIGIFLAGFIALGGTKRGRKVMLVLLVALTLTSGMLMTSCKKKHNNAPAPDPTLMSKTVENLTSGVTYYWKVVADDGDGAQTPSEVRTFKTL